MSLVIGCIMAGSRVGDTVLDPFMGSGTVGQVAQRLGRKWIGCELNSEYATLCAARTSQDGMPLYVEPSTHATDEPIANQEPATQELMRYVTAEDEPTE